MSEGSNQICLDELTEKDTNEIEVSLPHIRQLGIEVPEGWTEAPIGDIGKLDTSGVDKKSKAEEEPVDLVNYMDVYENYIINSGIDYMQVTAPDPQIERSQVLPGDILFTPSSEEPGDIGISAVVTEEMENTLHSYHTVRLRPTSADIHLNTAFSGWLANAPYVATQFARRATGSTRYTLTLDDFSNTQVLIPPISEQRKIAGVLYTVDQAIQKTEEIIQQTERLRKGVMQELFSNGTQNHEEIQETQYGTIPTGWEVMTIEEIGNRIGSGGTPNTDEDEYYGGDIAWVKTDDLNSGLVGTTKTNITQKGLDESAAKLFPEGTVVFAMYGGSLGQNGRLGMEAAMNQACCGIVTDESEMNPYLLHQQLVHRKQQLTALSAGTNQQNISQSMIEKFEVFVPSLEEQEEMADVLRSFESTIDKNNHQKEQLQRLKQGLMQDLLSGKVRTAGTDIEFVDEVLQHG